MEAVLEELEQYKKGEAVLEELEHCKKVEVEQEVVGYWSELSRLAWLEVEVDCFPDTEMIIR